MGACACFALVAIMNVVLWATVHRTFELYLAIGFAVVAALWGAVCFKWSKSVS
jgi:hypothetical protein